MQFPRDSRWGVAAVTLPRTENYLVAGRERKRGKEGGRATGGNFAETTRDDAIRKDDAHLPRSVPIFQPAGSSCRATKILSHQGNSVRSNPDLTTRAKAKGRRTDGKVCVACGPSRQPLPLQMGIERNIYKHRPPLILIALGQVARHSYSLRG